MTRISVTEVTKSLKGVTFPADKDELLDYARESGAEEDVIEFMQEMPEEEFESMADVMGAFAGIGHEETEER